MAGPLRVLLLEDQETDAELMVRELKRANIDAVCERIDTKEEFETHLDRSYDLILSDNSMPTFDALAALQTLQQRHVDIPFIIVSGSIGEEQAVSLLHHGAADYIMKDRLDRLGSAVQQALERKRLRVDNQTAHAALQARTRELMLSQERLRALASELTLTEQRERRKLATDLHDYLAQLLVVGRMKLRRAATSMVDRTGSQLLHELDGVLQDSLQYTRTLITNLAPSTLQEFGLTHALHWLSDHMRSHGLTVHIKVGAATVDLPEDQAILVFQSVRELLFNVVKHAQVKIATVSCEITSDAELRITVSDEGKGFDRHEAVAGSANPGRFGLFSIGERMQAMGGRFEVESASGRGTRATMSLPYWPKAQSSLSDTVRDAEMEPESNENATPAQVPNQRPSPQFNRSPVPDELEVPSIRVLLVDDHTMVRQGIRSLLDNHATIQVVGEASDGQQAINLVKELRPDVVIMDVNLPVVDGMTATHEMMRDCPGTVVIALSVHDDQHIRDAMQVAGAAAFVSKGSVTQELIEHVMRRLPVAQTNSP